jgi:hypothetical protein
MAFIAVAIAMGGSALVGAGATMYSSSQSAKAQNAAADKAAQSQKDANATNLQMYEESRGSTGSAVLPTYLTNGPNGTGGLFEASLGNDLVSAYNGSNVPLSTFQGTAATYAPAMAKAGQFTNDIFSGGITSKLLSEAQPVQQARSSSAMDALNKTLASIDAAQAGKGFSGDSYGNRMLQFQGRQAQGNANVANLAENQQIQNYGNVTLPSQNLNLPSTMANQAGEFAFMPQNQYLQSMQSRMQPLGFLKIGSGNPPTSQPLPTAGAGAYMGGANGVAGAAGALSTGAGSALNYYLNSQKQPVVPSYAADTLSQFNSFAASPVAQISYANAFPAAAADSGLSLDASL